jgi:ABC-type multidrug transport system fused ATPase/permease subunit
MQSNSRSFISITVQVWKLLSPAGRIGTLKNSILSIFLASLEVLTLTAILPLFYQLQNPSSNPAGAMMKIPSGSLVTTSVLLALAFVIKNVFALWLQRHQLNFINRIYITFSSELYKRFFNQSWISYLQENSAETFRKIKNTAFDFATYVLHNFLLLIADIVVCFLMIGFVAWLNYRIIFILAALCIPLLFFYYFFRKTIVSKIDKSFRELTPKANILLAQGIDSFAETRIYGKEKFFIERFLKISETTSKQLADLKIVTNAPPRVLETIGILGFVSILIYTSLSPDTESSLPVFLGLLLLALYRIIPSLNRILVSLSQIQSYAYAVSELREAFSTTSQPTQPVAANLPFEKAIQIRNLFFQYPAKAQNHLLYDLSLTIKKSDFVILRGVSGAGKTTLIHLLAGLIEKYEGEVLIDGLALSPDNLRAWQEKIGIVSQAPVILQDTVLGNITFGEDESSVNPERVKHAILLAGISEFIESLPAKLLTPIGENGLTLSGGQRQRLALARALYRNPEIILLDEVTNQLDEENKLNILKNLRDLTRTGKTIILASHDPVALDFATQVFTLKSSQPIYHV